MTKESRIPSGSGSSAAVTTSGESLPVTSSDADQTDTSVRRLGNVLGLAEGTHLTRRFLAAACPKPYKCAKKKDARKVCKAARGTWTASKTNKFDKNNWCGTTW